MILKYFINKLFGEKMFQRLRALYWAYKLKNNRFYESEIQILKHFVNLDDTCLDIGANFGQYTYPLSKLVGGSGKVFSFEPTKYAFEILSYVVKRLRLNNVIINKVAIGELKGEAMLTIPVDGANAPNFGETHFSNMDRNEMGIQEMVDVITLDMLLTEPNLICRLTFIKVDVEGAELMVFKGGKELLHRCHPVIFSEIEEKHTARYKYHPNDVLVFLQKLGYSAFVFCDNQLMAIGNISSSFGNNYIFIHKNHVGKYVQLMRKDHHDWPAP